MGIMKQLTAEDLDWDFLKASKARFERQRDIFNNKFNTLANECRHRRETSCTMNGLACVYYKCPKLRTA